MYNKRLIATIICIAMVITNVIPHFALNNEIIDNLINETTKTYIDVNESDEESSTVETEIDDYVLELDNEEVVESIDETVTEDELDDELIQNETEELEESVEIGEQKTNQIEEDISTTIDMVEDIENIENISTVSEIILEEIVEEQLVLEEVSEEKIASKSEIENDVVPVYSMGNIHQDFEVPYIKQNDSKLFGASNDENLPSRFDSRNESNGSVSIIPPVRNQNPYGTCWAFTTIGMVETDLRKKGLLTTDDDDSKLSEAALAYFAYNLKNVTADGSPNLDKPGLEGNDYTIINEGIYEAEGKEPKSFADIGGNLFVATSLMTNHIGAVKVNGDTKYDNVPNMITNGLDGKYAFNSNAYEMENAYLINMRNRDLVKNAIMDHGAVGISYYAVSDNSDEVNRLYYHQFDNTNYTDKQWSFFSAADKEETNHAVMIVGWDDNVPASSFYCEEDNSRPTNNGAWLCRNSWGEDWIYSDDGYFWLSYEETSLSSSAIAVDAVKAGNYEYNYHYDTAGFSKSGNYLEHNKLGHVYKVSDDENQILEAINLGVVSEAPKFEIEIYTKDSKMNNCADGTLRLQQEVSKELSGYYTIALDKKIALKKGSYYSIVIRPKDHLQMILSYSDNLNTDQGEIGLSIEHNQVESGQTFLGTRFGSDYQWDDIADLNSTYEANGKLWGISYRLRGFANKARVITFDSNGGVGTMEDQYIRYASESYINKNQFTKDDCIFIGWEDDDHNLYSDGESITLYNDLNLRASWSEVSKIVALENPTKTVYNYGETVDLSGLKVRLIYTNGETADIVYNNDTKNDFSILNNFMSASNKVKDASIIRVKYKSKDIEFDKIDGVRDYLGTVAVNGLGYPITINNTPNFTEPITIYKTGNVLPVTVLTTCEWDMNETYEYNFLNNKFPLILYDTNKNAEWSGIPNYDSAIMMYFYGMGDNNNMRFYDTVKDVIIPEGKIDGTNVSDGLSTTIRSDKPMSFYFRNNYVVIILSRQNDKMYFYPHFSGLLNSIVIKDKPNKLNYLAGEKFDPTGLAIIANNVDKNNNTNSRDFVYNDRYKDEFTFSPSLDEALTPDVEKITVSFRGFSCDLPISVAENTGEMVTVTFDYDDDGKIDTVSIPKGSKVMEPNTPTKKGYIFKQWEKQNDEGIWEAFDFNTSILEDITLEVFWSAKYYSVRFFEEDWHIDALVGYDVPYKYRFDLPFTRASLSEVFQYNAGERLEGKVLTAWYCKQLDENVTYITPDDSLTSYRLNGIWRNAKYNIEFDLDGVAATNINSIEKEYNNDIALPTPTNIPDGYEFLGWYYNDNRYDGSTDFEKDNDANESVDGKTYTLKAHWKRAIVFNVLHNGKNINAIGPQSIEITGETKITLQKPLATGYTFDGWYDGANFATATRVGGEGDTVTVSAPTTFYAKWIANTYTITYNTVLDGVTIANNSIEKTYGTNVTLDIPTKAGYDFDGWYKNYNTSTKQYTTPYDGTTDLISNQGGEVRIYAKWTAHIYTIKYNNNGVGIAPNNINKTYGTNITLANPTGIPTGYTFDGWYSNNNLQDENKYQGNTDLTIDNNVEINIYARWKAKISYNANGHGSVSPTYVDIILNQTTVLPTLTNVIGWTFDTNNSWYAESQCANLIGKAGNNYIVTEPKTLYAKWTENTYSITFELDGGSWDSFDPISMSSRKYSEAVTFPDGTKVKKTGYTFAGWYNKAETSQRILTGISANTVGDFVFVAKWNEKSYSITLNSRGGTFKNGYTSLLKRNFTERKNLPTENDIEYPGHRFDGWYEQNDSSATNRIYYVSENTDAEKVFYAKWVKETYAVTLNANGGIVNSGNITNYTYGDSVTLPTDVTRAGYVFKGWWTADGSTGGSWGTQVSTIGNTATGNKTYYAKWAASYAVTFNLTSGVAPAEADITNKPATQNIESGGRAVRPTIVPTAPNFSFIEWYTDDTFTIPFNFGIAISRATTIYAKWENVTNHNVTFNLTSGTIHPNDASISGKPDTTYVIHNRKANKPGNPSAEGYKFVNWYTDNTFTTVWDFNTNVVTADDTVIYGKWEYQTYTVVYNLNGGAWANGFTPTTKRTFNISLTLPSSSDLNKYAYEFEGWYEDSELSGTAIPNISADTAKNIILYAKWTLDPDAKIITFAFDSSNNAAIVEQAFFLNEDTVLSSNIFTKKGYTFIGWKDLNGNTYTNTKELTGDIRLIAQWQQDKIPNTPIYDGGSTYTGGGGSGGGGGGGAGIAPNNVQTNLAPTTTEIPTIKIDMPPIDATLTKWVYDPISNKYKLNINLNGQEILAVNGFYTLNSIETKIVNNLPVPMITQNTYYFNALGDMITGWVKTVDNKYYFFENAKTVDEGKMVVGWKQIQNEWYYFNQDGSMFVNGITPDGYGIAADGKMIR